MCIRAITVLFSFLFFLCYAKAAPLPATGPDNAAYLKCQSKKLAVTIDYEGSNFPDKVEANKILISLDGGKNWANFYAMSSGWGWYNDVFMIGHSDPPGNTIRVNTIDFITAKASFEGLSSACDFFQSKN